jgi:prepilin-type N-terminal cleavage/methylation domain-containing protein
MKNKDNKQIQGFSLVELILAMTIMLILLGLITTLFAGALSTRERESSKTDALTSAQAALNVISREIGNSGYGLNTNGIVVADSTSTKVRFRANIDNTDSVIVSPEEDITYYFDNATDSIVRYDPNDKLTTSVVVNRISNVKFQYFDYAGSSSTATETTNPTSNTGRVRITVTVQLEEVRGQPKGQKVVFTTDVTLRNSNYMLNQY